jgi:hypothetical protein
MGLWTEETSTGEQALSQAHVPTPSQIPQESVPTRTHEDTAPEVVAEMKENLETAFGQKPWLRPGQAIYQTCHRHSPPWNAMIENVSFSGPVLHVEIENNPTLVHTGDDTEKFYETTLFMGDSDNVKAIDLHSQNLLKREPMDIRIDGYVAVKGKTFEYNQGDSEGIRVSFLSSQPRKFVFGQDFNIVQKKEGVAVNGILVGPLLIPKGNRSVDQPVILGTAKASSSRTTNLTGVTRGEPSSRQNLSR